MALQQSGVELVVKNFSGFIGAMGRVNGVIQKQGEIATKSAHAVTAAGDKVANAQRAQLNSADRLAQANIRLQQAQRMQAAAEAKVVAARNNNNVGLQKAVDALDRYSEAVQIAEYNVEIMARNNESNLLRVQRAQEALAETQQAGIGLGGLGAQGSGVAASISMIGSKMATVITAIFAAIGAFTVLSSVVNMVLAPIKTLVNLVAQGLVGAFKTFMSVVLAVGGALLKTFGAPVIGLFNYLKSKAQEVTSDFMDVLGTFQRFQIMFQALQARDISNAFGVNMAEAFTRAIGPAKGLFEWVKKLAVTTPFTAKGITEVLAMANAMGLTTNQAKDLTAAVGNFTAGMGLTEEHMWRIIYNFGQMLAQGKVTGREFRDLAISFVPVWKMLDNMAKSAGMATDEFKKLALEGKVPVPAFFKEFIRMANQDFPGAMERMAKTWEGVIGNAKDFVQVILGVNLFGKMFNQITASMANSLQELIKYLSPISKMIGNNLYFALDTVKVGFISATNALDRFKASLNLPTSAATGGFARTIAVIAVAVREVGVQIGNFIDWLNRTFSTGLRNVAKNAGTWGYNIVAMVAWGMNKAVGLIVQVISYIASVMSYWLSPGSPPKALPELPKWGMEAMAEYLRGFTEADFDALEGIQKPLEQALSILVDTGRIGEEAAAKLYKDLSMAIAKAMETGVIEESLFRRIAKAAGPFGKEIAKLAKLHIQLAQATKALAAAEKALEEARKREGQTRAAINSKVREYNAMIRAGADKAALTAKLAEVNAAEDAARLATQERVKQEELVASIKEQVEALKEAVSLQERLIQQLLDITRKQIIDLDTSAAEGKMNDLAGILENMDWGIPEGRIWPTSGAEVGGHPDFPAENKAFQDWNAVLALAKKDLEEWKKSMGTLFDPMMKSIGELEKAWGGLMSLFGKKGLTQMGGFGTVPKQKTNLDKMIDYFERLGKVLGIIKIAWDGFLTSLNALVGGIGAGGALGFVEKLTGFIGLLGLGLALHLRFMTAVINIWIFAIGWLKRLGAGIQAVIDWFNNARNSAIEAGNGMNLAFGVIGEAIRNAGAAIASWLLETGPKISKWVSDTAKSISDWAANVWSSFTTWATNVGAEISTWATNALNAFITWGNNVLSTVGAALVRLWNKMKAEFGNILYWTNYHWEKIKKAIGDKIEEAKEMIRKAIAKAQEFINSLSASKAVQAFRDIIAEAQSLYNKIVALLNKLGILKTQAAEVSNSEGKEQFGGNVYKGKTSIVGERGWEMFVPGANGMILNQLQLARVVNRTYDAVATYGARPALYQTVMNAPMRAPVATAVSNTLNINFGGVVIANDMDMAVFEARVRNVVRQEFS